MSQKTAKAIPEEELNQLSKEQLVEMIKALQEEIARLKQSLKLDSKTSSKPPSGDLLKKSEKKTQPNQSDPEQTKRSPGGQLGHPGKTRKGFGRIDRIEVLQPQICPSCGGTDLIGKGKIEVEQVAQLVAKPIEIVEYQRHHCQCGNCGASVSAAWSDEIIPGQDLGVRLQALIGWLGNYGHLPYTKTRERLYELGQIDIGEGTLVVTTKTLVMCLSI
jgi:transposase